MNSGKTFYGDRPYEAYDEYLEDQITYAILLLKKYISSAFDSERTKSIPEARQVQYKEILNFLELELKQREIDEEQEISDWSIMISDRKEMSQELELYFPMEELALRTGLKEFGVLLLTLSLLCTINQRYRRVFQLLQSDGKKENPNPELCARIYIQEANISEIIVLRFLERYSQALMLLFPELTQSEHLNDGELVCDDRLVDLLLGQERYLTRGVIITEYSYLMDPLMFREKELESLTAYKPGQDSPIFLILGEKGAGKKHLVRHLSGKEEKGAVFLDIKSVHSDGRMDMNALFTAIRYAARECISKELPLAITGTELLKNNELQQLVSFLKNNVKKSVDQNFLLSELEQSSFCLEDVFILELKPFSELQRIELWKYYTRHCKLEERIDLKELANTFLITPGQIIGAIRQAAMLSGGDEFLIHEELLYKACYLQLEHKLAEKTRRVNTDFTWEDLKIADSDKEILRDICNCIKNRHIVMNEWNFARIVPYGAGLTVLFSGPPGTGKTMAAQVIASELKMELYKIDLSQLFDKYVGETEKNIRQIFDQAKKSNSILFFDEADSIFHKRIEATSSNDRFANIESSLLLQCVEEYNGISILATNNMNSIDAAFIRRFKYYVLFREPEEQVRYEIWKSVIPKEAPLSSDVDLKLLAKQFQFTGAVIKNVVLASAYLAAEQGRPISLIDILISIKREMFKNNLILTKEKLGSLGYLFDDIR